MNHESNVVPATSDTALGFYSLAYVFWSQKFNMKSYLQRYALEFSQDGFFHVLVFDNNTVFVVVVVVANILAAHVIPFTDPFLQMG